MNIKELIGRECKVCGKPLKWNYQLKRIECPKIVLNPRERPGCGWIHEQTKLAYPMW